jgi:site-specific DNA-methyltransferase (adenine-specific)
MMNIHNQDCIEAMKEMSDNQFDLAIVDPPYGIGLSFSKTKRFKTKGKLRNGEQKDYIVKGHKQKEWNKTPPTIEYFKELLRVSKKHIIWGCNYYGEAQSLFGQGRIIHNKLVTPFLKSTYSHADIAATNLQNRITMFDFQWSGNVQAGTMNTKMINDYGKGLEKRIHPTQKPIKLYEWLLMNYAKEGDTILDTHLGSGSIAIAANNLKYDLTAYEIDKEYFEAAQKRINIHKQQKRLFI